MEILIVLIFLAVMCLYFVSKNIYLNSKMSDLKEELEAYKTIAKALEENERKEVESRDR